MKNEMIIATHDGVFHADDVLACAVLHKVFSGDFVHVRTKNSAEEKLDEAIEHTREAAQRLAEEEQDACAKEHAQLAKWLEELRRLRPPQEITITGDPVIVRTRDNKEIDAAAFAVDVGRVHDPANGRFDHHQGAGERPNGIPYAAFGLVWAEWGEEFVKSAVPTVQGFFDEEIEEVVDIIDRRLVQSVDAADNGVNVVVSALDELEIPTLSTLVSSFNPTWREDKERSDENFLEAMETAKRILARAVIGAADWVIARERVRDAVDYDVKDRTLVFTNFVPWQRHIFDLDVDREIDFVVFPGNESTPWMVQCVPPEAGSFEKKVPFPEEWAGLDQEELREISGVETAIFCHRGRFIAGAGSAEDAMKMAELAQK